MNNGANSTNRADGGSKERKNGDEFLSKTSALFDNKDSGPDFGPFYLNDTTRFTS